ncbi:MAG: carboxymuconolactone decarboxylase, partial [Pseudomonas fluorescens]
MNKTLLGIAMCAATPFASAAGQADNVSESQAAQQIRRAGTQVSAAGPADYFSGRVRVDPLFPATGEINASGAYVTFEPGARSAWHTHPAGQRLVVIAGVGLTQAWGKP